MTTVADTAVREAIEAVAAGPWPDTMPTRLYDAAHLLAEFATARLAEPPADHVPDAGQVPADLVETVARIIADELWAGWDDASEKAHQDWQACASAILAALAGRIVEPGMVAVPVADLRVALWADQNSRDVRPVFERLRTLAEEAGDG